MSIDLAHKDEAIQKPNVLSNRAAKTSKNSKQTRFFEVFEVLAVGEGIPQNGLEPPSATAYPTA